MRYNLLIAKFYFTNYLEHKFSERKHLKIIQILKFDLFDIIFSV